MYRVAQQKQTETKNLKGNTTKSERYFISENLKGMWK